jgi:hypothetical protein
VHVDAGYVGHEQHGEVSFHPDPTDRRIEWSARSGYRGWLTTQTVRARGSRCSSRPSTVPSAITTSRSRSTRSARCPRPDRIVRFQAVRAAILIRVCG